MIRFPRIKRLAAALALLAPALAFGQSVEFGNIQVVQNDADNNATSVTLSKSASSSPNFNTPGGNRGDYDVSFGTFNDVAEGVVMTAVSQNGRDNSAKGDAFALFYGSSGIDWVNGTPNKYWIPVFRCANGDEANLNTAAVWFNYSHWLGGFARNSTGANGGALNTLTASAGINLGTQFVDLGGGTATVNLTSLSGSSASGILLVTHAKNEDNYAMSRANADGTFTVYVHDNGADSSNYEQDPIAFVYLPVSRAGSHQLVALGRVNSNATTDVAGGTFTMTKGGTGQWYLAIPGHSNNTGVLMISPCGGVGNTFDNVVSYEWDGTNSRWVIESRDLSGATTQPTLQNGSTVTEDMFSFAFFKQPTAPTVAITAPASMTTPAPAAFTVEASASDSNGTVAKVEFVRNGIVIGSDDTAPYTLSQSGLVAGTYTYIARAIDNEFAAAYSTPVTVTVTFDPNNLPPNTALSFDGVDDHVTMGTALELGAGGPPTNGLTLECWFRKEGAGIVASSGSGGVSGVPLFGKGRGEADGSSIDCDYFFGINTAGQLVADFEAYAGGLNYPITGTNTPITDGVWHHAAVTYDGSAGTWTLYLDGAQVGTAATAAGVLPRYDSIQHFGIGSSFNSTGVASGAFAGVIDEVRVWNYARTPAQIAAGKGIEIGSASGLIGRFGLNEGLGLSAQSSAGTTTGTLTNGPLWVLGAPFTATNNPPTVTLTAPVNEATSFMPYPVTFTADATDADSGIIKVEFRVDGVKVGEDTTAPYSYSWTPTAVGTYSITARAEDTLGASAISTAASLIIQPNPNQPPVLTLGTPASGAVISGSTVALNATISDPEGAATTVTFYGRPTIPATPGPDFSIVAIPDTQYYSEGSASHANTVTVQQLIGTFGAQTQWVLDNKATRNIAFVSHMGDIVNNGNNGGNNIEWQRASAAMGKLENPFAAMRAYGVPFGLAPGNHDIDPIGAYDTGNTDFYDQFFPASRFEGRNYWGGHYGTDNTNNYQFFSASGLDFIVIHLSYDTTPNQDILDWADALLKAHPHRRAIVTSHYIVGEGNPASFSTQGAAIYNNLKDNPNLILLLCGHIHAEGRRSDTFQGRTVHSVLSDYQGLSNGGNGFLRIFTFSPANNRISVESWSPTLNRAAAASDNLPHFDGAYNLTYNMQTPVAGWVALGTVNVPAGGTAASLDWTGLELGHDYEWYAAASDTVNVVSTTSRSFKTTAGSAPTVTLDAPLDGATYVSPATVNLSATASDTDGSIARVEFYRDGSKIGEDTTAPYEITLTGVQPGSYVLSAVAFDDIGVGTVSNGASITVNPGDLPPTVSLTAPAANTLYQAPANITLTATASDTEGPVTKVEFLSGTTTLTLLGEDTTAPYSLDLTSVGAGSYTFTARATDSVGQVTSSTMVNVSVYTDAAAPNVSTASVGTFDLPSWTVATTSPAPRQFNLPGTDAGDLELRINGTNVVFNSGITLASNWNSPGTIASGTTSRDNICQPYANASGRVFVSVLDNSNDNAADGNPSTTEQSAGLSVAFVPYSGGWSGATVDSFGVMTSSGLPAGVGVTHSGTGTYRIDGLATTGTLLAFTNGDTGTLADNVCSVRIASGRWWVDTRDNAGGVQNNEFSFLYIPSATTGVYAGRVSSTGAVSALNSAAASLGVTATVGTDGIDITVGDGSVINPTTATIFVVGDSTSGGASSAATDNLICWEASGNKFRVFSQDLPVINGTFQATDLQFVVIPFAPAQPAEVTIAATDASAGEYGADQALNFTITRSMVDGSALTIPLTAGGSASQGTDYSGFQSSVVIAANQASVTLPLQVLSDSLAEGDETVTITIGSGSGFVAGTPATAQATIADRPSQNWAEENIPNPALRGAADDADGDGHANLVEYFMGSQPGDVSSSSAVDVPEADGASFKVRYRRAKNRPDVSGTLQWSTDLTNWFGSGQSNGTVTVSFSETVISSPEADPEIVEATATITGGSAEAGVFVRLQVQ